MKPDGRLNKPYDVRQHVFDARKWRAEYFVPEENISEYVERSPARQGLYTMLEIRIAHSRETKRGGSVPATLGDWLRHYAKAAFPGLFGRLAVNRLDLVVNENFCPHMSVGGKEHVAWLEYGDSMENVADKRRDALYAVLNAARRLREREMIGGPQPPDIREVMYALRKYEDLA